MCCCQCYCTWKRFSSSLQWVTLIFTSLYSKQRFCLCLAKWRCFRILFLRTTFSSVFVTKVHFYCSILLEKCFGLLATKLDYFELYITKASVCAFLSLKYTAFSFIRGKTPLGFFAVKLGCSQRYRTGKRFSASFQRVMLIFISFCSKQRFDLFSAKLRYFQHYFSENRLFLVFVRKLYFWPFILSKTCFGVLAMKSEVSGILLKKNSDFVFRCFNSFFGPHSSENTFLFAGNKIALLWALYYEKKRFSFFVAKTRCTQLYSTKNMFWFVCWNIGLLHQKKVFEYAGSHPDFHLILLKQRFCFLLAKLRCLTIVFLRTTLFSVSVTKRHFTLPNKCFCLLATKLGYLEP